MALIGSAPALSCSCDGTLLVGKVVQPLQSVKPIRIAVSTVLDESRCGHKISVWVGDVFWCELFSGLSVWLCAWATADGKSGSSTVVSSKQLSHLGYETWFAKIFSKMNPCMSK
jgi:hypothetical protein